MGSDYVVVFVNMMVRYAKISCFISFSPIFITVSIGNVILGHCKYQQMFVSLLSPSPFLYPILFSLLPFLETKEKYKPCFESSTTEEDISESLFSFHS